MKIIFYQFWQVGNFVFDLINETSYLFSDGSRISHRGGMDLIGGHGLPKWLHFIKCVCQNERIGSFRGAGTGCANAVAKNLMCNDSYHGNESMVCSICHKLGALIECT